MRSATHRRHLALVATLAVFAVTGTACATTRSVEVSSEDAVVAPPLPPNPVDQPGRAPEEEQGGGMDGGEAQATQVEPNPEAQDPRPVAWDRVSYDRQAGELTVFWWSGVEPCVLLADVTVEVLDDEVVVTVLEGSPPNAATISCVAMAVYKSFTVGMDQDPGQRRFVDGAA